MLLISKDMWSIGYQITAEMNEFVYPLSAKMKSVWRSSVGSLFSRKSIMVSIVN